MGAPSWPEFERLAGATLRSTPTPSRRSPVDGFRIHVVDRDDPVTRGMREYMWTLDDDMYTNMRWDPAAKVHVLVTGHDDPAAYAHKFAGPKYPPDKFSPEKLQAMPGVDQDHPLVWTNQYGKGRVYCFTLGHGPDTLQYDAVTSLLVRGAEWAASSKVTIALKDKAREFESTP
jgi:type 1 glutamine amidotransferase